MLPHRTPFIFSSQSQLEGADFGGDQQQLLIEDIFQKHLLLEQDISVHGDRMKDIQQQSEEFINLDESKGTCSH